MAEDYKEKALYKKLLEVQKEVGAIKKDSKNPFFNSKYFDVNAVLRVLKPIFSSKGLLLVQGLSVLEGKNAITTNIIDVESGVALQSNLILPESVKSQDLGSAITYYRRYHLQSMLALEAEDDDGNLSSQGGVVFKPTVVKGKIANKPRPDQVPFGSNEI